MQYDKFQLMQISMDVQNAQTRLANYACEASSRELAETMKEAYWALGKVRNRVELEMALQDARWSLGDVKKRVELDMAMLEAEADGQ